MMALGLKPVIIKVKTKSSEAIELREAKKPFVVENKPIKAKAKIGKLINGVKNTLSSEPLHKNTGAKPLPIFPKKCEISKSFANNNSIMASGLLIMLITKTDIPLNTNSPTTTSGNFGKLLITNLRCGWQNTKITQKIAKYTIYGVKIESSNAIAKKNEYIGFGLFSPWILEPSQSSNVGQNKIIINGVPEPVKNKNGVDNTTKHDAKSETLFLNQRFRSKIKSKPKNRPTITLGNLIAYGASPKIIIDNFCSTLYGKSTKFPVDKASKCIE